MERSRRCHFRISSHATHRKKNAVSDRPAGCGTICVVPELPDTFYLSVVSTINYDWCGNESSGLRNTPANKEERWRYIRSPLEFLVPVLIRSFLCSFHHAVLVSVLLIHLLFSLCQRLYTQAAPTHRRSQQLSGSCASLSPKQLRRT